MIDISVFFNFAFPATVGGALACYIIMTGLINNQIPQQQALGMQRLSVILRSPNLVVGTPISCEQFVTQLRNQKVDIVTIPDSVTELRITKAYIISGIILSISFLFVVILLEFGISGKFVSDKARHASFLLCALDVFLVLLCVAWALFTAQRVEGWSGFKDILRPK